MQQTIVGTPVAREQRSAPPQFESLLSATAHLLLEDTDVDMLCQRVFDVIRDPLQLDVYFHYLLSEDGSHLTLASAGGNQAVREALGSTIGLDTTICGTVARTCKPLNATHVQQSNDPITALIRSYGIRCYSCKPLLVHGRLIGTLSFGSMRRDSFRPDEIELFHLIVAQVTLATERRLQNTRLREMERLALLGRMSATLAHEINNPLDTLNNILYLMRDALTGTESRELLQQAEEQVARLGEISHRTLDLFRGRSQHPHRTDLGQLAHEVVSELRLRDRTLIDITAEDNVFADIIPGEMRQVLFNLLLNASHFSPPGISIQLKVRTTSGFAEIHVRDEGIGISEETRRHLFQPFYTTRGEEGTGVGLWVSREMVERVSGTLTFDSNPALSPGTDFIIRLPLSRETDSLHPPVE